jgi:hypothetical protein
MAGEGTVLQGFAYGEQVEGVPPRSLGHGLLAPAEPQPWGDEVEALARGLQATAYPDSWPPVELFCSVLLSDGQRVVAVARYGLHDHTPSRRRGGLELVGVVAPGNLGVAAALGLYRWLRERRAAAEALRALGGSHALGEVLTAAPSRPSPEPPPTPPIHLCQEDVLLLAATSPSDPDSRLGLLVHDAGGRWQWLPLCGADFPLQSYARRGPLVAWVPYLSSPPVKLDRKPAEEPPRSVPHRRGPALVLAVLFLALMGGNLWALLTLPARLAAERPAPAPERKQEPEMRPGPQAPAGGKGESREQLALALQRLLGGGPKSVGGAGPSEKELLERYRELVRNDPGLRVEGEKAQAAVGLVSLLARYSPEHVARVLQEELGNEEVMRLIEKRVRARLLTEGPKR